MAGHVVMAVGRQAHQRTIECVGFLPENDQNLVSWCVWSGSGGATDWSSDTVIQRSEPGRPVAQPTGRLVTQGPEHRRSGLYRVSDAVLFVGCNQVPCRDGMWR